MRIVSTVTRVAFVWAIVAVSAAAMPSVVVAQSVEQQAGAVTHRLLSPYCPGLLLADCGSQRARDLRAEILQRLQRGETVDAVERDLVARFGPAIRTVPAFGGFGLVVWLGPLALGVAGLGFAVLVVRRAASHESPPVVVECRAAQDDARLDERLQRELDALD
jgi:cytochrome c-type biogenesis protein CcmH